jgi:hypothetical protein
MWATGCGPDRQSHGISDDKDRALRLAGEFLLSGQAVTTQVEAARFVLGAMTLTDEYQRVDEGWRGQCRAEASSGSRSDGRGPHGEQA